MSLTNAYETDLLEHLVGKTTWALPTPYFALYSVAPDDTGGGTELSAVNGYARVAASTGATWTVTGTTSIQNGTAIPFGPASGGDWAAATHLCLCASATEGTDDIIAWTAISGGSVTVLDGQTLTFAAGAITFTAD